MHPHPPGVSHCKSLSATKLTFPHSSLQIWLCLWATPIFLLLEEEGAIGCRHWVLHAPHLAQGVKLPQCGHSE